VLASTIDVLNAARDLPFVLHETTNEDLKLKYRYLDLRRPDMQRAMRMRTKLVSAELYRQRMRMCLAAFALVATAIAVFITIFAGPIVLTLFGEQYGGAAAILQIHIWGGIFIFQRAVASKWMIAEDLFMFSFVSHGVGALLNIVLNLVLIPHWGAIGSAVATVISYAGASYLFTFCSRRTWPMARMMTETMLLPLSLPYALLRTRIAKGRKP
jgi:PST family polysaccharide transporter